MKMFNWEKYWNALPKEVAETEFLQQVGRTVNGQPIPLASVDIIADDIVSRLELNHDDYLLDMCCGNGLITARLSPCCGEITAVDFSEGLIQIANKYFIKANVSYEIGDARTFFSGAGNIPFTKILMNACVQHFEVSELQKMLTAMLGQKSLSRIYFTSIPDKARLWDFYNTPERKADYHQRIKHGRDAIGTWWDRGEFELMAESLGYKTICFDQPSALDTAHYRFDALLMPKVEKKQAT